MLIELISFICMKLILETPLVHCPSIKFIN